MNSQIFKDLKDNKDAVGSPIYINRGNVIATEPTEVSFPKFLRVEGSVLFYQEVIFRSGLSVIGVASFQTAKFHCTAEFNGQAKFEGEASFLSECDDSAACFRGSTTSFFQDAFFHGSTHFTGFVKFEKAATFFDSVYFLGGTQMEKAIFHRYAFFQDCGPSGEGILIYAKGGKHDKKRPLSPDEYFVSCAVQGETPDPEKYGPNPSILIGIEGPKFNMDDVRKHIEM